MWLIVSVCILFMISGFFGVEGYFSHFETHGYFGHWVSKGKLVISLRGLFLVF